MRKLKVRNEQAGARAMSRGDGYRVDLDTIEDELTGTAAGSRPLPASPVPGAVGGAAAAAAAAGSPTAAAAKRRSPVARTTTQHQLLATEKQLVRNASRLTNFQQRNPAGTEGSSAHEQFNAHAQGSGKAVARWRRAQAAMSVQTFLSGEVQGLKIMAGAQVSGTSREEEDESILADGDGNLGAAHVLANNRCLFHPDGTFRNWWDLSQVFFLLYVVCMVPLRTAFELKVEPGTTSWLIELVVDSFFIVDVCINFRTAFVDENFKLSADTRQIRRNYMRGWFGIDLLSVLPINYVIQIIEETTDADFGSGGENQKVLKAVRLVRLTKLLRVARIRRLLKRFAEQVDGVMVTAKFTALLLAMTFASHILCCIWYAVGHSSPCGWVHWQYAGVEIGAEINMTAAATQLAMTRATCLDSNAVYPGSEAPMIDLDEVAETAAYHSGTSLWQRYILCFWYTYSMLIGSELYMTPMTSAEIVLVMVMQTVGVVAFGIIIGEPTSSWSLPLFLACLPVCRLSSPGLTAECCLQGCLGRC
eukprot:SAG22_NODE_110_length_19679_cov_45.046527_6_plen_532_part_00